MSADDPVLVHGRPRPDAAVAVCVPVLDGADTLAATLASVLAPTRCDLEVVVVDNASTDATAAVLAGVTDPRVAVWRNPCTVAMTENFRRAVALSHAPLVKVLPADDLLDPRGLDRQVAAMDADPGLAVVAGRQQFVDERGAPLVRGLAGRRLCGPRSRTEVVRRVVRDGGNPVGADPVLLFRRRAYDAVGGYPEVGGIHGDLALVLHLLEHGAYLGVPDVVARFRVAPGTHSATAGDAEFLLHRAWVAELVRTCPEVRRRDALLGALGARLARFRRRALFGLVRRRAAWRGAPGDAR